jgi:hypothetical protein
MLTFERRQIVDRIDPLPPQLRAAFAAACAQRQLPNYIRAAAVNQIGGPGDPARILSELWESIESNAFELKKLKRDRAACERIIDDYYDGMFEGFEFAEDAVASLIYALDTACSRSSQDAMWAAERAHHALFDYIVKRFDLDPGEAAVRSQIDAFPIMQAEMSRQQADLLDLHAAAQAPGNEAAVIARIKRRAESDAASFFG